MMLDTCTITALGEGDPVLDEDTGIVEPPVGDEIYDGPCRVQANALQPANPVVGETEYTTLTFTISVPVSVTGVEVGAVVTVTASQLDPDLVDRSFTVTGLVHKTYLTARRLVCEEVS